jgi:transposase
MKESKKRLGEVVAASGTTVTEAFGAGPVVAALIIGHSAPIGRFANRDRFAAYNGTAPVEVSSGGRQVHRLSQRGNRQVNHALHMAAVTQIRYPTQGRAFYEGKVAEGKAGKEAVRALKRRISDEIYRHLKIDAERHNANGPGGQKGSDSVSSAAGSHPQTPALRTSHSRTTRKPTPAATPHAPKRKSPSRKASCHKEASICMRGSA